jgi:hypothetical protein
MDEKSLKLLIENGAVKKVNIIGRGGSLFIEVLTQSGAHIVTTQKGQLKTWSNINTAAKWIHSLGIGTITLKIAKWQPDQKIMLGNA